MTGNGGAERSIDRHLRSAAVAIVLLIAGFGGWAALTEISGAVIAQGQLVVDSNVKKVQHPTGGVVGELRVHDGDHVKAGDVLLRLDETQTRANLEIAVGQLYELRARQARAEAERDGSDTIVFPAELMNPRFRSWRGAGNGRRTAAVRFTTVGTRRPD